MLKPYQEVAIAFAQALVDGQYECAHDLLAPELRDELTPAVLEQELFAMFVGYADGDPEQVDFDPETGELLDWPDKLPDDAGWAYVSISGEDFNEAVTVIVSRVGRRMLIRNIEWGRP